MQFRSWLLVPGDDDQKLGKAVATTADVIVVDLDRSVGDDRKALAREMTSKWLAIHRRQLTGRHAMGRWVRINPLASRIWREDLVAAMRGAPDGIILPDAAGPADVQQLGAELYELEQANQVPTGTTRIIPMVADTAQAALTVASYVDASLPRLAGLMWSATDLCESLGASRQRDSKGNWTATFAHVRAQVLLTAHARGIMAIDTAQPFRKDEADVRSRASEAKADGFTGQFAVHPAQVPSINAAFAPDEAEVARARAIIDLHDAANAAGTVVLDRRKGDHLKLAKARRVLGLGSTHLTEDARPLVSLRPA